MTPTILLLAAGSSSRYGSDKRQALLADGRPLIDHSLDPLLACGLPVTVCLRPEDEELAAHLATRGATIIPCPDAAQGMGASLASGVRHLQAQGSPPVLVALADMPRIQSATVLRIAQSVSHGTICAPVYRGRRGHPVAFGRDFFEQLGSAQGDRGGAALIADNARAVHEIVVDDPGILLDVDTPEALQKLSSQGS